MSYKPYSVRLSKGQKMNIKEAFQKGRSITLRFSAESITGDDELRLTESQIKHLNRAKAKNTGAKITLTKTQLTQTGGVLPFLAPLLPLIIPALTAGAKAVALGALGGLGKVAVDAIANKARGKGIPRQQLPPRMINPPKPKKEGPIPKLPVGFNPSPLSPVGFNPTALTVAQKRKRGGRIGKIADSKPLLKVKKMTPIAMPQTMGNNNFISRFGSWTGQGITLPGTNRGGIINPHLTNIILNAMGKKKKKGKGLYLTGTDPGRGRGLKKKKKA